MDFIFNKTCPFTTVIYVPPGWFDRSLSPLLIYFFLWLSDFKFTVGLMIRWVAPVPEVWELGSSNFDKEGYVIHVLPPLLEMDGGLCATSLFGLVRALFMDWVDWWPTSTERGGTADYRQHLPRGVHKLSSGWVRLQERSSGIGIDLFFGWLINTECLLRGAHNRTDKWGLARKPHRETPPG
jgi:hypothetical protein